MLKSAAMNSQSHDIAGRILGVSFFGAFAAQRIYFYALDPDKGIIAHLYFASVTATFIVIAATYLIRAKASAHARGFFEMIFPFIPAALPLAVAESWRGAYWTLQPPAPYFPAADFWNEFWTPREAGETITLASTVIAIAANALVVWSLVVLRRAFSIMAEARILVRTGPYGRVRHPIYLGEILATAAICAGAPSPGAAILFAAFVTLQVARAFIEERKLAATFPEYGDYRKRTGMIFPRLRYRDD